MLAFADAPSCAFREVKPTILLAIYGGHLPFAEALHHRQKPQQSLMGLFESTHNARLKPERGWYRLVTRQPRSLRASLQSQQAATHLHMPHWSMGRKLSPLIALTTPQNEAAQRQRTCSVFLAIVCPFLCVLFYCASYRGYAHQLHDHLTPHVYTHAQLQACCPRKSSNHHHQQNPQVSSNDDTLAARSHTTLHS